MFSALGGTLIGTLGGFGGVAVWPGAIRWSFEIRAELFGAIAILLGVAEYLVMGWLVGLLVRASTLQVRRLAIFDGKLHFELTSGAKYDWPLARVSVSPEPLAGGWHTVGIIARRASASFFVPGPVASAISAALAR